MQIITSEVTGTVWKLLAAVGDAVEEGDTIAILESMKMEIPVESPCAGAIVAIAVAEGDTIQEGDEIAMIETPG